MGRTSANAEDHGTREVNSVPTPYKSSENVNHHNNKTINTSPDADNQDRISDSNVPIATNNTRHERGHTSGQFSLVNEFRQSLDNHIDTSYDMSFVFDVADPNRNSLLSSPVRESTIPEDEEYANDIKVIRSRNGENISLMTNGKQPKEPLKPFKPKNSPITESHVSNEQESYPQHQKQYQQQPPLSQNNASSSSSSQKLSQNSQKKGGFFSMFSKKNQSKTTISSTSSSSTNNSKNQNANSNDITAIRYDATEEKDAPVEVMFLPARTDSNNSSKTMDPKSALISAASKSKESTSRNPRTVVHKQSVASSLAMAKNNSANRSNTGGSPFNVIYGDDTIDHSSAIKRSGSQTNIYKTDTRSSFASNKSDKYNVNGSQYNVYQQLTPTAYDSESIQQQQQQQQQQQHSFNMYNDANFAGSIMSLGISPVHNSNNTGNPYNNNQLFAQISESQSNDLQLDSFRDGLISPTEVQKQNMSSLHKKSSLDSLKDTIKSEGKKLKNRMSITPVDIQNSRLKRSPNFYNETEFVIPNDHDSSNNNFHGNTIGQEIQINKKSNGLSSAVGGIPKLQSKKSFLRKFSGGNTKKSASEANSKRQQSNEHFENDINPVDSISSSVESKKGSANKKHGGLDMYHENFSSPTLVSTSSNTGLNSGKSSSKPGLLKEGDPEWYVKIIMDKNLTNKQLHHLQKKLRKGNLEFISRFLKAQGQIALSVVLQKIARRSIKTNEQLDREYIILGCLKNIINVKEGADLAIDTPQCILALVASLTSPRLSTRKLVTEILALLSYWKPPVGRNSILSQLEIVYKNVIESEELLFQPWLYVVEKSLDSRDLIGALIGDGDDYKSTSTLQDYCLTTLFLVTSLVEGSDQLKERVRIRNLFKNCHLPTIFEKMKTLKYGLIDEQISRYEENAMLDYEELMNISHDNQTPVEIEEITDDLLKVNKGTERENYLSSIVQNLLLVNHRAEMETDSVIIHGYSPSDESSEKEITRMYQLIDSVIYHIVSESAIPGLDSENVLNGAIQRIMDRLQTDDIARRAVLETKELSATLRDVEKERNDLREQLKLGSSGRIENLMNIITSNEADIKEKDAEIFELTQKIKELQKQMQLENEKNERRIQKLINAAHGGSESAGSSPVKTAVARSNTIAASNAQSQHMKSSTSNNSLIANQNLQAIKRMSLLGSPSAGLLADVLNLSNQPSPNSTESSPEKVHGLAIMKEEDHATEQEFEDDDIESVSVHGTEQLLNESSNGSLSKQSPRSTGPPPPPSFPPSQTLNEDSGSSSQSKPLSGPPPPPPPPPPPGMPGFLSPSSPPPPPPPVPSFLINNDNGTQPPPPPLPGFLNKDAQAPANQTTLTMTRSVSNSSITNNAPKPTKKLKQIHWDKVDNVKPTFWADKAKTNMIDELWKLGVLEEVETYFPAKESKIKVKTKNNTHGGEKVSFLGRDLAQQFGINLHMFASVSETNFVKMVLNCDKTILNNVNVLEFFNKDELTDITDTLNRNFRPYSTNFTIRPYVTPERNPEELERADRIYVELCYNLRHYWKSRSRALLIRSTYAKDYVDLEKKLQKLDSGINSVKESSHLKDLLDIIRSVGNFMNDITKQAKGFKIGTLQRLKFMKDDKNTMTFLHYIERIVRTYFPNISEFVDDLEEAIAIANLSVEQLENDCRTYEQQIKNIDASMTKGNLSDPEKLHPEDKILSVIKADIPRAHTKSKLLVNHLKESLESYNDLMVYFGENEKDMTARNTFFQKFSNFIQEYKKAHIENIQREEEQRAYEVRKRLIESKLKKNKSSKSGTKLGNKNSPNSVDAASSNNNKAHSYDGQFENSDSNSRVNGGYNNDNYDAEGPNSNANEDVNLPELVDDDDDDDYDEETNATEEERASVAVIDTLLQKLRQSGPDAAANSRRRTERKKRLSYGILSSNEFRNVTNNSASSNNENSSPELGSGGDVSARAQTMLQQLRDNERESPDPQKEFQKSTWQSSSSEQNEGPSRGQQPIRAKDKLRELRNKERRSSLI